MKSPLTPRQHDVLSFVRFAIGTLGYPPTMEEIADRLAISKVSAFEHVNALARKGYVVRDKHKARSIRIVGEDPAKAGFSATITEAVSVLRKIGSTDLAVRLERLATAGGQR